MNFELLFSRETQDESNALPDFVIEILYAMAGFENTIPEISFKGCRNIHKCKCPYYVCIILSQKTFCKTVLFIFWHPKHVVYYYFLCSNSRKIRDVEKLNNCNFRIA